MIVTPSLYGPILKWGISVCGRGISVVIIANALCVRAYYSVNNSVSCNSRRRSKKEEVVKWQATMPHRPVKRARLLHRIELAMSSAMIAMITTLMPRPQMDNKFIQTQMPFHTRFRIIFII